MNRRRSLSLKLRPAVWTVGTLVSLSASLVCSELVHSDQALSEVSPSVSRTDVANNGTGTGRGVASLSDTETEAVPNPATAPRTSAPQAAHPTPQQTSSATPDSASGRVTIADAPSGWATIDEEPVGRTTFTSHTGWQTAADADAWWDAGAPDPADRSAGRATIADADSGQDSGRSSTWTTVGSRVTIADHPAAVTPTAPPADAEAKGHAGPQNIDTQADVLPQIAGDADSRSRETSSVLAAETSPAPNQNQLPLISSSGDPSAATRSDEQTDWEAGLPVVNTTKAAAHESLHPEGGADVVPAALEQSRRTIAPGSDIVANEISGGTVEPAVVEADAVTEAASDDTVSATPDDVTLAAAEESETDSEAANILHDESAEVLCEGDACPVQEAALEIEDEAGEEELSVVSSPGWVTVSSDDVESSDDTEAVDTANLTEAADTGEQSEPNVSASLPEFGWRAHSAAPTGGVAGIEETFAPLSEDRETLPTPPQRRNDVLPAAGSEHPLSDDAERPALIVPPHADIPGLANLRNTNTGQRKSARLETLRVQSPRQLAQSDPTEPQEFQPRKSSSGNSTTGQGSQPVDLTPLLNPGDNSATSAGPPGSQLAGPPAASGNLNTNSNPDEQELGEAPEDTSLRFLRQQTVLLEPGEMQFDISFQYLNDKVDFVAVQDDGMGGILVGESQSRQRLMLVPLQLRVGVVDHTQLFVSVPFGWANSEVSFLGQDTSRDKGGIGDVSAGLVRQIIIGNEHYPDVLSTVSFSAPTGNNSFQTALLTPGSNLGEGFWSITSALTFIQNYEPLVLFYGTSIRYRFDEKFNGNLKVDPGLHFLYRFGVGFAVNPNVTLSATFNGSYIGEFEVNGENVGGSSQEPMQIRFAATINKRKTSKTHSSVKLVEPFVTFGLNDDAIDTIVGITWTH